MCVQFRPKIKNDILRMICRQLSSVRRISLSLLRVVSRKNPGDFRSIRGGALSKLQQNDEERNQMQEYLALEEESRSHFQASFRLNSTN